MLPFAEYTEIWRHTVRFFRFADNAIDPLVSRIGFATLTAGLLIYAVIITAELTAGNTTNLKYWLTLFHIHQ